MIETVMTIRKGWAGVGGRCRRSHSLMVAMSSRLSLIIRHYGRRRWSVGGLWWPWVLRFDGDGGVGRLVEMVKLVD